MTNIYKIQNVEVLTNSGVARFFRLLILSRQENISFANFLDFSYIELAERLEKEFEDAWLLSMNPEKDNDNENKENSALLSIKFSSIISSPSSSSPTISTDFFRKFYYQEFIILLQQFPLQFQLFPPN